MCRFNPMKLNESKYTNDFAAVMFWTVNLIINRMKLSNHDLGGDRFVHVLLLYVLLIPICTMTIYEKQWV